MNDTVPADPPSSLTADDVRGLNDAARTLIEQLDRHGLGNLALFEQQVEHLRGHLFSDAALASSPAPDLVLVRRDSGGVFPDGTTNHPAIDFDAEPVASSPAPAGLDVERLADWMMDHLPEYHRWMTTGWRDTMRDEAVVLARDMIRAATRTAEDAT